VSALPLGWRHALLGDVAETALGKMLDRGRSGGHPQVPYLRNVNVQWGRIDTDDVGTMELADDERERFGVEEGDLLVCEGGEIGRAAIWRGGSGYIAYQKALHRVRPSEHLDLRFLLHQLRFAAETGALDRLSTGSTIKHLPQQLLRRLTVVVPPLDEQRQIVDILEDHLSRLDAADAYLDAASRRSARLAATELWHLTHGHSGSTTHRLDEIAEVRLGRQRSPANHSGARMRRYLRAGNVDWNSLRLDDVKAMNFSEAEEAVHRLAVGDILVVEASGSAREVGKSAIYDGTPGEVCFQNTLLRVRCHAARPEFVQKYILAEAMAGRFISGARGVGINHIGRAKLAAWPIGLPPDADQERLARQCDAALEGARALAGALEGVAKRRAGLRRALLVAAFSGRLTGHASDMDLAEELVS